MINRLFNKKPGFTIVELLIVIVVMAILLSITIVGYGSVQRSARNAQTASAVGQFKEALILYRAINKKYPAPPTIPAGNNCLGKDYPGSVCWGTQTMNPTLTNLLEQISGGKLNMPAVARQGLKGAVYAPIAASFPIKLDGTPASFIFYAIEGDEPCPVGPVTAAIGGNIFEQSSTPPASGQSFPVDSDGIVQCWISLPNK